MTAATTTIRVGCQTATVHGPGRSRSTEATAGAIRVVAPTKADAKAALTDAVTGLCENIYKRRYLGGTSTAGTPVVFAFYYADGWRYDIVTGDGLRYSTTCMAEPDESAAFEQMRRHFNQYVGEES